VHNNNSDDNNINKDNVYGAFVIAQPLMNAKQSQVATDHQIKLTDLVLLLYYYYYITEKRQFHF